MRSITKAVLLLTLFAYAFAQFSNEESQYDSPSYEKPREQAGLGGTIKGFINDALGWGYSVVNRIISKLIVMALSIVKFILPEGTFEGVIPKPLKDMYYQSTNNYNLRHGADNSIEMKYYRK